MNFELNLVELFDGAFKCRDEQGQWILLFNLGAGTLLMRLSDDIPESVDEDIPTFWVTAPTLVKTGIGVALNAKFDLDPGRSYLIASESNNVLVQNLRDGLLDVLRNSLMWDRLLDQSEVGRSFRYRFYWGLWKVFSNMRFPEKWQSSENGTNYLRQVIWGTQEQPGAYRRFIEENQVFPTGLNGCFERLQKLPDVRCSIPERVIQSPLSQFVTMNEGFVSSDVANAFRSIGHDFLRLPELGWKTVFESVCSQHPVLTPEIFNGELGQELCTVLSDEINMIEVRDVLKKFKFMTRDQNAEPRVAKELLGAADAYFGIANDGMLEGLRMEFASDDYVLSDEYDEHGKCFFRACKKVDRDGFNQSKLGEFLVDAWSNNDVDRLNAALRYVGGAECSEMCRYVIEKLGGDRRNLLTHQAFQRLPDQYKLTVAGKLNLPVNWEQMTMGPVVETFPVEQPPVDTKDAKRVEAQEAERYTFKWMKACVDLEILESGGDLQQNEAKHGEREATVIFDMVERLPGSANTFLLSHPRTAVPGWFREEHNQPVKLFTRDGRTILTVIKEMAVDQSRVNARLAITPQMQREFPDGDYTSVMCAETSATRPGFLLAALKARYEALGLDDDFCFRDILTTHVKFIYGPPGTGKTTALARDEIVEIVQGGNASKILVLAPTNKAADVVAERILEICMARDPQNQCNVSCWLTRFGLSASDKLQESGIARGKEVFWQDGGPLVVVTTVVRLPYDVMTIGEHRFNLRDYDWDCVMFDEASMIPLMQIVYPLYLFREKHLVIAGDPNQIEPVVKSAMSYGENIYTMAEIPDFGSLADVADIDGHEGALLEQPQCYVRCLMKQRRSLSPIGEVFSRFCYAGRLAHARRNEAPQILRMTDFPSIHPLTVLRFPVERSEGVYKVGNVNWSSYHIYSALFTFEYIRKLSEKIDLTNYSLDRPFRIGIISPYRIQAEMISHLLEKDENKLPQALNVQASTAHGFQGDECELIIAMLNPPGGMGMVRNIEGIQRESSINNRHILNVAISRARDYLVVALPYEGVRNYERLTGPINIVEIMKAVGEDSHDVFSEESMQNWENTIWPCGEYIRQNTYLTGHQAVNIYTVPEKRFEVRSESKAIDIQFRVEYNSCEKITPQQHPEEEGSPSAVDAARASFIIPRGYHKPQDGESYVPSGKAYFTFNEEEGLVVKKICECEVDEFDMNLIFAIEGALPEMEGV